MSSLLYRLGHWSFGARLRVLLTWLTIIAAIGIGARFLSTGTDNTFSIPGTESGVALDQLAHTFPQVSGTSARLVVVAPPGMTVRDTAVEGPLEAAVTQLKDVNQVAAVTDPLGTQVTGGVSNDGSAAVVTVQMDGQSGSITDATRTALLDVESTLRSALPAGSTAIFGGDLFSLHIPTVSATEGVGVLVALAVLVVTFGSFLAAGMPLVTALLGVGISTAAISLATRFATISSTTPMLALMLGLAVGIDYSLFIVSRHQAQLRAGLEPRESAARALATAGSAVVFAGLTVMIALVGLAVARIPFLSIMGFAAAVAVGLAVLIALTLTPALLGFAGDRVRPGYRRERRAARRARNADAATGGSRRHGAVAATTAADATTDETTERDATATAASRGSHLAGEQVHQNRFFLGWVRAVTRWPVVTILLVVLGLGAVALPALDLRLALPDAGTQAAGSRARVSYDLLAEHFGPGYNGPLIVTGTIVGSKDPMTLMSDLKKEIEALPGVASVPVATPNADATTGIIQVVPTGGPDSQATKDLVAKIRSLHDHFQQTYGVNLSVTGVTAVQIDISDRLGNALLPFGILVVGLSFVLLTMVFRSLWVPLKATLGYLLSVAASFGVVAMVFEKGWGASLFGLDHTMPVISFMPIVLMGVLFGLAMDYEVFLVSRMREDYVHGGDARAAIRSGFTASAVVVTAAATIMFSVFAAFVPEGDVNIKPIALGLASGVFVDAFVVRMTLVPAVLQLLGDRAWHMPRRLDRILPSFDIEGEGLSSELALADWPEPGADDAIVAAGLRLDRPDGTPLYRDVSVRVPTGGVLVVAGPHRSGRTAVLLTIAGRAHADDGALKVDGLVAPVRARDIRRRVAFARLMRAADPVSELREAFAPHTPVVVVDDLDAVADPVLQRAVRDELRAALTTAAADGRPLTLVVSAQTVEAVRDLLPAPPTTTLTLTAVPDLAKVL
ncbi:MMPL family transporter [Cellulomonas sp. P24]|uniref:MMPL family transporter n=1 Tax=Cellulomonas sp. P24 TaxID=2885206 RepID=UPI00216B50A2|nr:MMPL family transporter [Cellulomonas sp. P24]MCR6492530.1 MMPL family transporter [Cellulomonas sp. P24]